MNPPHTPSTLRIATRASALALWQAEHVAARLRAVHPGLQVELLPMRTQGDRLRDAPLAKVGGKGLFVKELEVALIEHRADLAVHSMKDVPVELPEGLHLPVLLERADPRDALVSPHHPGLDALPSGATVGTSSLRRQAQLRALRPDLRVENLRGGVHRRLARLDAGDFDAIVLACAGLQRLGLGERIGEALDPDRMLPAIGQGVLGIECRADDARATRLIGVLHDADTAACVAAERALNHRLGGGCQVPIAGHARVEEGEIALGALVARVDGALVLRETARAPREHSAALGRQVAERLLARGADRILAEVYAGA